MLSKKCFTRLEHKVERVGLPGIKDNIVKAYEMSATDWLVDCVVFAGAFGFALLQLTLSVDLVFPDEFTRRILGIKSITPSFLAIVSIFIMCIPVVIRRRYPWISYSLTILFWFMLVYIFDSATLSLVAVLISLFTVACECSRAEAAVSTCITLFLVALSSLTGMTNALTSIFLLQNGVLTIAVAFAGYALQTTQKLAEEAESRAQNEAELREKEKLISAEMQRAQIADFQRRSEEQRLSIARDVHDITAHSLSAVNIQAQAALSLIDSDVDAARESIVNIKDLSKESLSEIRSLLDMLRASNASASCVDERRAPVHDLTDISEISKYLDAANIESSFAVDEGVLSSIPLFIQLALYEIVREVATNAVKHSGATKLEMKLESSEGGIALVAKDNGCGADLGSVGNGGHGLEGIKERVSILDGSIKIRTAPNEGFEVDIAIPISEIGGLGRDA